MTALPAHTEFTRSKLSARWELNLKLTSTISINIKRIYYKPSSTFILFIFFSLHVVHFVLLFGARQASMDTAIS